MPFASTLLSMTTTPLLIISSASTWGANSRGASLYQPLRLKISNTSTSVPVYIGPSSSTADIGFAIPPLGIIDILVQTDADVLFGRTSAAGTATIGVLGNPA